MNINFDQQFTHSASKGRDHTQPVTAMPQAPVISVPEKGITDSEYAVAQRQELNVQNAWMKVIDRYKTHELEAKAHEQAYKATQAAVQASTAWQGVRQAVATNQSTVLGADYAELKVAADRERYQVQGRTLLVEVSQAKVDLSKATLNLLQSAHDLVAHRKVRVLNGVGVDGAASPDLKYEEVVAQLPPAPEFKSSIDFKAVADKFKAQTRQETK